MPKDEESYPAEVVDIIGRTGVQVKSHKLSAGS